MATVMNDPRKPFLLLVMNGYLEAMAFTEMHSDNPELKDRTPDDLSDEARNSIASDLIHFLMQHGALIEQYMMGGQSAAQLGHDIWLTRNRHGVGFWDRGLGDLGDKLTKAAHTLGESCVYLGDDGKVWV